MIESTMPVQNESLFQSSPMKTILFITDLVVSTRVEMLAGMRDAASAESFHLEVIEMDRLKQSISKMIDFWNPHGCIIDAATGNAIQATRSRAIPFVLLDPDEASLLDPSVSTVTSDAGGIADLAIKELSSTGCSSYAYAGWMDDAGWSRRRAECFRARLSRLGKECHILDCGAVKSNQQRYARELRDFLESLETPCGIFAANDQIASIVLEQLSIAEKKVPGDFFVVGVDDNPVFCDNLRPSLTSIRPGFTGAGRTAMRILVRVMERPGAPPEKQTYHPIALTPRLSSRRIAATSKRVMAALDLIRREACSGLKAQDVVLAMGLSDRMAEIEFKAATGKRITEEITDVRLEHVKEILSHPGQEIGPIANRCGWNSEIYLKRLFKARFGMTMSEWRRLSRGLASN